LRVGDTVVAEEWDVAVEVADRGRARAAGDSGRESVALIGDAPQAVPGARRAQRHGGDAREIGVRHIDDRPGFGPRAAVAVDERGAHRSQQPFAHDDPSIARVSRFQATRAEQHDARDSAPATQSVLHRRLAEDEVGVTGIEVQHAARGHGWQSRPRLQPRHELADGPVELEPDVDFARL